ncbi:MAG: diaminopimelate epimerase [Flavobacteriaceae bacterium]
MAFEFYKYQGTGNDFVLIDNRLKQFPKEDTKLVAALCDRRFGIGADGLILLESHPTLDFTMVYYNSDGNLSSMCGNGGRCLVMFANFLGLIHHEARFEAVDGIHFATINNDLVSLGMSDVEGILVTENHLFLNTGSPHHVQLVEDIENHPVFSEGRSIRHELYGAEGANVNFVEQVSHNSFKVRTYERGVEDETLSCGTGVTAVALAMFELGKTIATQVAIETPGGVLKVQFEKKDLGYAHIQLIGPAIQVFKGVWA